MHRAISMKCQQIWYISYCGADQFELHITLQYLSLISVRWCYNKKIFAVGNFEELEINELYLHWFFFQISDISTTVHYPRKCSKCTCSKQWVNFKTHENADRLCIFNNVCNFIIWRKDVRKFSKICWIMSLCSQGIKLARAPPSSDLHIPLSSVVTLNNSWVYAELSDWKC